MKEFYNTPFFTTSELSEESFKELLPEFFEEVNEDYELLLSLAQQEDWTKVRKLAHKMKGTASSYSALRISETALALQELLDESKISEADQLIEQLKETLNDSMEYAKTHF